MTMIFHEILNMSIVASWLIVAVILLRIFLKKAPRKIVCFLWALVAVRLICPFSFESRLSLIPSAQPIETMERQNSDTSIDSVTANGGTGTYVTGGAEGKGIISGITDEAETVSGTGVIDITGAQEDIGNTGSSEVMNRNGEISTSSGSQNINIEDKTLANPPSQGMSLDMVISAVWVLGIILMLGYGIFSYAVISRRTAVSMNMEGNIYLCDDIDTPFILGVFSPKVYLPSLLKEEEREYVIAHENAHLGRCDHWWKPLGYVILAVHWFNPLVWVAYVLLCRDIEIACDEKVISGADIEYKKSYAKTLLECSARGRLVTACPLAFGEVSVKERIRTVLNYRRPAFWVVVVSVIACIVVGICFLTNPVSGEAEGEPSTQENVTEPESDEEKEETDSIQENNSVQESEGIEEIDSTQETDGTGQETDSSSQSEAIIHDGWRITADEHSEYRYIYAAEQLRMRNMNTGEWYELTAFDLSYNYYDYDELKEGDIARWNITLADAVLEEYTEGDVGVSIYRYEERLPVESDAKPGEGYLVIYGASDSDTVWYTFMPLGMSREEVDAFLADIHVERLQEPIRYYDPESELSCMEQFEVAEDKMSFLYGTVSTEDNKHIIYEGMFKNVFDCYAQEAVQKDPELYETLKNPVGSAATLFDLEYESAEVYHCGNMNSVYGMLVLLKLSNGQEVAFDMEKRGEVWQPVCQWEADSEYCINVKLQNEYINDVSAEQLKIVTNEVEFIDREWMELGNDYVVLNTVANRDIVLYGLYGGAAMILRDGEKILPIWISWTSPQMELPRIYCGDYDNDGSEEYALWTHMATGTGVSGDELYIIETDWEKGTDGNTEYSMREYRYWDWISELNVIGNRFDEASGVLTITLNDIDVAELDISRLLEESGSEYAGLASGNFYSFEEKDGQWYFKESGGILVSGQFSEKRQCKVIVNAKVVYDETNGFHLEDIQISTESEYE